MMNLNTLSAVVLSVLVGSSVDLNTEVKNDSPVEVNSISETSAVIIDDFSTEIYSWWTGSEGKFVLARTEDEMLAVKITDAGNTVGAGNGYHCFGRQFDAVDFTKTPVIKVRMKADVGSPKVRIDLKDANGMVTNASAVVKTVVAGDKFTDYYFDFSNKWNQAWPDKQVVDAVEIVEMLVFVNPGGPGYTGNIVIDDINAITVAEISKQ